MKALRVKLGRKTLTELSKRFGDGPYKVRYKDHDGRIRLIVELPDRSRNSLKTA